MRAHPFVLLFVEQKKEDWLFFFLFVWRAVLTRGTSPQGLALVSNPRVMFLDEPTSGARRRGVGGWGEARRLARAVPTPLPPPPPTVSPHPRPPSFSPPHPPGLDSFTANEVMSYVKELVGDGVTSARLAASASAAAMRAPSRPALPAR